MFTPNTYDQTAKLIKKLRFYTIDFWTSNLTHRHRVVYRSQQRITVICTGPDYKSDVVCLRFRGSIVWKKKFFYRHTVHSDNSISVNFQKSALVFNLSSENRRAQERVVREKSLDADASSGSL